MVEYRKGAGLAARHEAPCPQQGRRIRREVGAERLRRQEGSGENQWLPARWADESQGRPLDPPAGQAPARPRPPRGSLPRGGRTSGRRSRRRSCVEIGGEVHAGRLGPRPAPATNRLPEAAPSPKYQSAPRPGPGAVPAEAVAVDQPAGAADLEVLDDPVELEPLRKLAALVAARAARCRPRSAGRGAQFDPASLVVAAAPERDRRAGQDDQAGVVLDLDRPLLGGVARQGRVDRAWPTGP